MVPSHSASFFYFFAHAGAALPPSGVGSVQ
jgi:hypothetical protein